MEPRTKRVPHPERAGPAYQHEECRLERVVSVGVIAQDAATDAEHHRTVAAHQDRERRLVAPGQEAAENLGVPFIAHTLGTKDTLQMGHDAVGGVGWHATTLRTRTA